jgi:ferredoxin
MPTKPPGYVWSGTDEPGLSAALEQLSSLTGTFEKPRFFEYDAAICAHGRSGQIACSRCIESCPADAIVGLAEAIEVDPYKCQGGGVCASVCPTGAIRYTYPRPADTLGRVQTMLHAYLQAGGEEPVVVFAASQDSDALGQFPVNWLLITLEELASVGLEVWLSSLAYGACRVVLLDTGSVPRRVTRALGLQLQTAQAILSGLGYPADAIALHTRDSLGSSAPAALPRIQPAGHYPLADKRQTAYLAIDHLQAQALRPKPMANLPAGAPFGSAEVKESACTLCLACVSACPGKALQDGYDRPELRFIEANCVQCGLCTRICPEDAIAISPRILFDHQARAKPRILCQDEPFCCRSCGKPFATRSVISKMLDSLKNHPMFQTERARHRLTMCDDCRVVDIVQDAEAMEQGFRPPAGRH